MSSEVETGTGKYTVVRFTTIGKEKKDGSKLFDRISHEMKTWPVAQTGDSAYYVFKYDNYYTENKKILVDFINEGQYYYCQISIFNDGKKREVPGMNELVDLCRVSGIPKVFHDICDSGIVVFERTPKFFIEVRIQ